MCCQFMRCTFHNSLNNICSCAIFRSCYLLQLRTESFLQLVLKFDRTEEEKKKSEAPTAMAFKVKQRCSKKSFPLMKPFSCRYRTLYAVALEPMQENLHTNQSIRLRTLITLQSRTRQSQALVVKCQVIGISLFHINVKLIRVVKD